MTNRSNDSRLEELQKTYGVKPCRDKEEFFSNTDIIVLAFKPKDAAESIENIREYVKDQLVISVIAGLTIHTIQQYFGRKLTIIRAMPNTSAAIQQSATGFSASIILQARAKLPTVQRAPRRPGVGDAERGRSQGRESASHTAVRLCRCAPDPLTGCGHQTGRDPC